MTNVKPITILQFLLGLWMLKWFCKLFAFVVLIIFAIIDTPFWLIFRTRFNPWSFALKPLK